MFERIKEGFSDNTWLDSPTLVHDKTGSGLPDATQFNVMLCPSTTTEDLGWTFTEGASIHKRGK